MTGNSLPRQGLPTIRSPKVRKNRFEAPNGTHFVSGKALNQVQNENRRFPASGWASAHRYIVIPTSMETESQVTGKLTHAARGLLK